MAGIIQNTAAEVSLMSAAAATSTGVYVASGDYNWFVWGTFDGCTATLQWSPDGGSTYISYDGTGVTTNAGFTRIPITAGYVRVLVASAGGSTSISSKLYGVP